MSGIIAKTKILLKGKKSRKLLEKTKSYIRYIFLSAWFKISLKETDPDLKKVNKNWIIYTYLKQKYSKFIKNYDVKKNKTHEYSNFVWWCWFQEEENAPEIVKACLNNLRKNMSDKKVIVITEKNMWNYVSMPNFIKQKYKKGIISKTHLSDLLRLEILISYGGTWIDSTGLCTKEVDFAFDIPLFAFKTNEKKDPATFARNWFLSAEKNNPILLFTRDLLVKYWNENNSMLLYFLFYFFMKLTAEKYSEEGTSVPFFSDILPPVLQHEAEYSKERLEQIKTMTGIHKLSYKFKNISDTKKENTLYKKILEEYEMKENLASIPKFNGGRDKSRGVLQSVLAYGAFAKKGGCA